MKRRNAILVCLLFISAAALADGVTLPPVERIVLENGTVLILNEKHDVPLIGLRAVVRGGVIADPEGKSGLSFILAGVLQNGAGNRDAASPQSMVRRRPWGAPRFSLATTSAHLICPRNSPP